MIRFNIATKARRASVKLRTAVFDFEGQGLADGAPDPSEQFADQDLIRAIEGELSPTEMEIVALWLDGVSWADIGKQLGCTADAARVRLDRAFARVRKTLSEDGCTKT